MSSASVGQLYERHAFEPSPVDVMTLQLLVNDIRASADRDAT